ncbi:MAG: TIGR04211 family SH3 domain-containing protein [Saccharospirillaceae bacterium]|nr:TIGR04211 family SH3 domain-containing protein [Pseudomonadales bacterium]NRB79359.1 TIGR04211 family SH3 domain-containing protein [Saccharospirillaceae bacterium]
MKNNLHIFLSIILVTLSLSATAKTGWLSDQKVVHLRDIPASKYENLETLYSGAVLEIIVQSESTKYQKVKTASGKIGWINKLFVFEEPVASVKLKTLQKEFAVLTAKHNEFINTHKDTLKELEAKKALQKELKSIKAKYDSLALLAGKQVELDIQNTVLLEDKAKLEYKLDQTQFELDSYKSSNSKTAWMTGAALVCLGVILCLILINLPKKNGRKDGWS